MTWLIPLLTSGLSLIGEGVKGFFGIKTAQIQNIDKIIETLNSANISAGEREKAIASVIMAETSNGYWLSAVWRPIFMVVLVGIVVAYSFGWTTPNLLTGMPENSMLRELFELLKIGVMGYMPLRTVDKAIEAFTRTNMLNKLLEKLTQK